MKKKGDHRVSKGEQKKEIRETIKEKEEERRSHRESKGDEKRKKRSQVYER